MPYDGHPPHRYLSAKSTSAPCHPHHSNNAKANYLLALKFGLLHQENSHFCYQDTRSSHSLGLQTSGFACVSPTPLHLQFSI